MMVADTPLIAPVTLHLTYIFLLKVLAFLLAYATILLGYRLIASGAKGEFKFSGKFIGASADLVSISPGLLSSCWQ